MKTQANFEFNETKSWSDVSSFEKKTNKRRTLFFFFGRREANRRRMGHETVAMATRHHNINNATGSGARPTARGRNGWKIQKQTNKQTNQPTNKKISAPAVGKPLGDICRHMSPSTERKKKSKRKNEATRRDLNWVTRPSDAYL